MTENARQEILRNVSRSFYLSLRVLPAAMRRGAAAGYLLARMSDTIADGTAEVGARMAALWRFSDALGTGRFPGEWSAEILAGAGNPGERALIKHAGEIFRAFAELPEMERKLVRDVVATIIGGQMLDLERFGNGGGRLVDEAELLGYTWRVAGCVGEFWTDFGFLTLGERFSDAPPDELRHTGKRFGMGLQLVNILRDIAADLRAGRCYLPCDPENRENLLETHTHYLALADQWMGAGLEYARAMRGPRLRLAAGLPARIGKKTLHALHAAGTGVLDRKVKIPRREVYAAVFRSVVFP